MDDKLKIYACSGVGDARNREPVMYEYWMDNTKSIDNTQAVNSLLISINYAWIRATRLQGLSKEQCIKELCKVDFYTVCLDAAKRFANQPAMLSRARGVIYSMVKNGLFNNVSMDGEQRDAYLDDLLKKANEGYDSDVQIEVSKPFAKWWKENIENLNKVGLSADEREKVSEVISGIAATNDKIPTDPIELLNDSARYFIYTFMSDAQLARLNAKSRVKVEEKRSYQKRIYNFNLSMLIKQCGSKAKVDEIIRTNIINNFGKAPEKVCDDIISGKTTINGIGSVSVLAIIAAIGSLLIEIVKIIVNKTAAQNNATQNYKKPTNADITNGLPGVNDVPSSRGGDSIIKYLPLVATAGLVVYVLND